MTGGSTPAARFKFGAVGECAASLEENEVAASQIVLNLHLIYTWFTPDLHGCAASLEEDEVAASHAPPTTAAKPPKPVRAHPDAAHLLVNYIFIH